MPPRLKYLILIATLLRMLVAAVLEFGNDEAYYFLYALDVQPNYFDHPPGVAILIKLFTLNMSLTDEFFVRLGAIVCAGIGTWFAYQLGIALKNERTGWFAAILYTVSLYTSLLAGTFIIPDSPQVVAWMGAVLVMHGIVTTPADQQVSNKAWMQFGFLAGLAILCKVHGVFLWASMGAYLVMYGKERLRSSGVYLAAAITAVLISPILIWNIQNDFVTYRFHSERVEIQDSLIHLDFFVQAVVGQLLYCNPVNAVLIALSAWKLRTMTFMSIGSLRFILINGLPLVVVTTVMSLFNPMLPHWSGPGFMLLSFLAAAYLDETMSVSGKARDPRVLRISAYAMGGLIIAAVLVIELYPGTFGSKNKERFGDDDFTLDLYGWRQFSDSFGPWLTEQEQLGEIPPNLPLVSSKWFPAAHVEYYVARPLGRPVIGVGWVGDLHQYVWLNKARPELKIGGNALCIVPSNYNLMIEDRFSRDFGSAEIMRVFYSYRGGRMARYFTVYLLRDYKGQDEAHRRFQSGQ